MAAVNEVLNGFVQAVRPGSRRKGYVVALQGDTLTVWLQEGKSGEVIHTGAPGAPETLTLAARAREEQQVGSAWVTALVPASKTLWRSIEFDAPAKARTPAVLANLLDVQLPFAIESALYTLDDPGGGTITACAARQSDVAALRDRLSAWDPAWCIPEGAVVRERAQGHAVLVFNAGEVLAAWTRDGAWRVQAFAAAGPDALVARFRRMRASEGGSDGDGFPATWRLLGFRTAESSWLDALRSAEPEVTWEEDEAEADPILAAAAEWVQRGGFPCFRSAVDPHTTLAGKVSRRRWAGPLAFAVAGVVLAVGGLVLGSRGAAREAVLDERIAGQAQALSGLAQVPKGQEMLVVGRALAERKATDAAVGAFFDGGAWRELGALFDWARTRGVQLDGVEVRPDVVSLQGSSVAWETGEDLKKKLEEWGFACELKRQGKDARGRVPFTVEGVRL